MLQSSEHETEILLGNKQLLAVFFVGVVLLAVAFTGGYMLGRGAGSKKLLGAGVTSVPGSSNSASENTGKAGGESDGQVGETHSVPAYDGSAAGATQAHTAEPPTSAKKLKGSSDNLLGARKEAAGFKPVEEEHSSAKASKSDGFAPQSGQEFLQVTAVPHDHAVALAAALRRKGFHAHAVPRPGNAALYRVIVGPIHDPGELSSTRDSLRKTGFSQVIVQHYE